MYLQTILSASAAGLSAAYFLRGAVLDLRSSTQPEASGCGACASGGCPAARKD